MDFKRAQEIINSQNVIEVFYNGSSVWLENIQGNFAEVKNLSSNKVYNVPIDDLNENQ